MADRLKSPPRVARDLTGSGALPSPENLIKKTPEELIKTLNRFGIEPDLEAIDRRAIKAFVTLNDKLADGQMPSQASWDKMASQYEKEMAGSLRQMTKQAIRLYKADRADGEGLIMWLTSGGDNVCPDCEPLHGQVDTMANWRKRGLPGTSKHVCHLECQCHLIPA